MKKRISIIISIVIVVFIICLITWRFWPQSFSNLMGVDESTITSCSVYAMVGQLENGGLFTDTYELNDEELDEKVYQEFVKILATSNYQQDFRNLLPWGIDSVSSDKNYDGELVTLTFYTTDTEKAYFGIKFMSSSIVVVRTAEHPGMRIYHPTNRETIDKLVAYLQTYGQKETLD